MWLQSKIITIKAHPEILWASINLFVLTSVDETCGASLKTTKSMVERQRDSKKVKEN